MNTATQPAHPTFLLAPLDWGLGHATRCIPIIKQLLSRHCRVILAGEERVKTLLQQEFPDLVFLHLPGYRISYSTNKWTLPFTIAAQIPKILSMIEEEHEWLEKIVAELLIDVVISDNRYGLYHSSVRSIFITHQLHIRTGMGKLADELLMQLNYDYINRFSECWVPDLEDSPNLAGGLSHPEKKPEVPVQYLGGLSRFQVLPDVPEATHLLIVLSGPEPQRTILETLLLEQLERYEGKVVLVRGVPGGEPLEKIPSSVEVHEHVGAAALNLLMQQASFVIARCGYSTVMDLAVLKKKSILIPTPGQTEQEYLGKHLMELNFAFCVEQGKFRLAPVMELAAGFSYRFLETKNSLEKVLDDFIADFVPLI